MGMKRLFLSIAACFSVLLCLSGCMHQHEWVEATCTEPRTCAECGETEGEPLGHAPGEWSAPEIVAQEATQVSELRCSRCGEVIDRRSEPVASFVRDGGFAVSPYGMSLRFSDLLGLDAEDTSDADLISYGYSSDGVLVAMLSFVTASGDTLSEEYKYDAGCNPSPLLVINASSRYNVADVTTNFVMTCDPALSYEEALGVVGALVDSLGTGEFSATLNGVEYLIAGSDNQYLIRARVA